MAKVNLERWKPHVEAAKAQGATIVSYALEHGLSRYSLYAANAAMKRLDQGATGPEQKRRLQSKRNPFVPVELAPAKSMMVHVTLANGIELRCESMNVESCAALAQALGALPCSR